MAKRSPQQLSLFGTATISKENGGFSTYQPARSAGRKKPQQIENNFRKDIEHAAAAMDLPCIHIEYFCGNKFIPKCERMVLPGLGQSYHTCGGTAICSKCGRPILAHCKKTNNNSLAGQPDIIGVAWAIETKCARNKKGEGFKPTPEQQATLSYYQKKNIPVLLVSTAQSDEAVQFLRQLSIKKTGKDPIAK